MLSVPKIKPVSSIDVRRISECIVKPLHRMVESQEPCYLTPWDLCALNYEYMQFSLLFTKSSTRDMQSILDQLKSSLSAALSHFFLLSGRFLTQNVQHPPDSYIVSVDSTDNWGAEFIYAVADMTTISDLITPADVPQIQSLFALDSSIISKQGDTLPLLVVQVTELIDGIFIACSINHALADGTSFWHFINSWSEICRSSIQPSENTDCVISRPPVTKRWFLNNQDYIPSSKAAEDSIFQFEPPTQPLEAYRQRVFNFTSKTIATLKAKANAECNTDKISSYQALAALVWRSITRARGLPPHQITTCVVLIDCRSRLDPPLSKDYFGNSVISEFVSTTADELLSNSLGWGAQLLHSHIISYNDAEVCSYLNEPSPYAYAVGDPGFVFFGGSPRFDVYGNDFGWGKPVGVRWYGSAIDGTVYWFPGREMGSVDLIMYLFSGFMDSLELDTEFMDAVSPASTLGS